MDIATISILVIIVGCIVGLAEWIRFVKIDAGIMAAQIRAMETKIERLEEQFLELYEETESIEAIVQETVEEQIVNERIFSLIQEKLNL